MNLAPDENSTLGILYELLVISACWIFIAPVIFLCAMVAIPALVVWGLFVALFDWISFFFEKTANEFD